MFARRIPAAGILAPRRFGHPRASVLDPGVFLARGPGSRGLYGAQAPGSAPQSLPQVPLKASVGPRGRGVGRPPRPDPRPLSGHYRGASVQNPGHLSTGVRRQTDGAIRKEAVPGRCRSPAPPHRSAGSSQPVSLSALRWPCGNGATRTLGQRGPCPGHRSPRQGQTQAGHAVPSVASGRPRATWAGPAT